MAARGAAMVTVGSDPWGMVRRWGREGAGIRREQLLRVRREIGGAGDITRMRL